MKIKDLIKLFGNLVNALEVLYVAYGLKKASRLIYNEENDLDSAKKEENPRWAVTKAYQALFLMCNSILVRKLGFYSKDHNCVLIALSSNELISEDILTQIREMLNKKNKLFTELPPKDLFYEEIFNIRIIRNKYLYLPKSLRMVKAPSEEIVEEVRQLIRLLGELE